MASSENSSCASATARRLRGPAGFTSSLKSLSCLKTGGLSGFSVMQAVLSLFLLQSVHNRLCVLCNHQLFIGGDHQHLHFGVGATDFSLDASDFLVLFLIDNNPHKGHIPTHSLTGYYTVFTNAPGKHQNIDTPHCCNVAANELFNAIGVHIKTQLRINIALLHRILNLTHIR